MREITYLQALAEAIREEMRRDQRVFVMGEDVGRFGGVFGVTSGLLDEFGEERVRDTPISESGFIGCAVGAALTGMRPLAELIMIDFAAVAMDPIVNQAAKMRYMFGGKANLPLVIRTAEGTGRGAAAQHSQCLESWFLHIPGLLVAQPATPYDAKGLLKTAVRGSDPVLFIEHKMLYRTSGPVPEEEYLLPFGVADVKRQGSDVTVIALSLMVGRALRAAAELENEGIDVEVIDPRTLKPLDVATLVSSARKTHKVLIVHEACKTGGPGAELAAQITEEAFDALHAPVARLAGWDTPVPFNLALEKLVVPDVERIQAAIKRLVAV